MFEKREGKLTIRYHDRFNSPICFNISIEILYLERDDEPVIIPISVNKQNKACYAYTESGDRLGLISEYLKDASFKQLKKDLFNGKFNYILSYFLDDYTFEMVRDEILKINKFAFLYDRRLLPYVNKRDIFEAELLGIYERSYKND